MNIVVVCADCWLVEREIEQCVSHLDIFLCILCFCYFCWFYFYIVWIFNFFLFNLVYSIDSNISKYMETVKRRSHFEWNIYSILSNDIFKCQNNYSSFPCIWCKQTKLKKEKKQQLVFSFYCCVCQLNGP